MLEISRAWGLSEEFQRYAGEQCLWVNSLVDRIVSEPLEPAGAVAEPYALWAVENRAGLVMPCVHKDVVVTDDLKRYERLKLFLLNLSHTYMAERWRQAGGPEKMLTREWLENAAWRADLEDLVEREVQPVFDALGLGEAAREYRDKRDHAVQESLPFSLSCRHLPQSRGQKAAPLRRRHRARPPVRAQSRTTAAAGDARRVAGGLPRGAKYGHLSHASAGREGFGVAPTPASASGFEKSL